MIRLGYLAPILLIALPLSACSEQEQQGASSILSSFGVSDPIGDAQRTSSIPVAEVVEVVEEPAPPPTCDNYMWRFNLYDCHGNWLRAVE